MNTRVGTVLLTLVAAVLLAACGGISTPVPNPGGPWYADPAGDDNNDCLSPQTACATIQAAINKSQPGGTVIASAGTFDENLLITKALILRGAAMSDTIVNANGSDRTAVVGSAQVEIHHLTLRNGSSTGTGGNLVNSGELTISNVRVELGSADSGGGIFNNGMLTLTGVELVGNGAEDGGGIYNAAGAIATGSQLLIENNPVSQAGGGIFNQGEFVLNDSVITANSAEGDGGGFFNGLDGSMDITGATISDNVTTRGYSGGGFYNRGELDLTDSSVLKNLADAVGGGGANNGTLLSINTDYEGNTSVDVGGGLYNDGPQGSGLVLDVRGGQFLNNTGRDGGALFNQGPAYLQDATLDGNQAQTGAGIFNFSDDLELVNVVISNNKANNKTGPGGGAIYSTGSSQVLVTDSLLEGNQALSSNGELRGGAIDSRGTELIIAGTTIRDNSAAIGGGVAAEHGHFELHSSTVEDNHASLQGGGIWLKEAHGFNVNLPPAIIRRSTLSGNSTDGVGGGLYNDATTLTVDDSTIIGNTATDGGGAFVDRADIYRTTFTANSASGSGGALLVTFGEATTLTNATISGNSAETGAAAMLVNGSIFLRYSTLANNQTASGAALRLTARAGTSSLARLVGSVLADNNGLNCSGGNFDSLSANVADDFSCQLDKPTDKQNTDPNLGPLQDNGGDTHTHALSLGSPAINSDSCHNVNQDQREEPRPSDGKCDSGAYEQQNTIVTIPQGQVCEAAANLNQTEFGSISLRERQGLLIVMEVPGGPPEAEIGARLGNLDFTCNPDSAYPDQLFCIGPELPGGGEAMFSLFVPECTDPVFQQLVSVPERVTATPEPAPTPTPRR